MDINEQFFLVFEGAMGFHCNRKKKGKMPFRFFKKNIRLILNSFFSPPQLHTLSAQKRKEQQI